MLQEILQQAKVLSREEEQALFRKIDAGWEILCRYVADFLRKNGYSKVRYRKPGEPLAHYLNYISKKFRVDANQILENCRNNLTAEEAAIVAEAEQARNELIHCNLRLVASIAAKFSQNTPFSFEDLWGEGIIGLCKAIDHYDIRLGTKFSTTAVLWISQQISRALANTYWDSVSGVHVPLRVRERYIKALKKISEQVKLLGRELTDEEIDAILKETKLEKSDYETIIGLRLLSLDAPVGDEDEEETLGTYIVGDQEDIETHINSLIFKESLMKALHILTPREREVILLYCGLSEEGIPLSLSEIAKRLKLTRQRITQIFNSAKKKLKEALV